MKIYDQNPIGTNASQTERAQEAQKTDKSGGTRTRGGAASASGDHVEFSGTLSRLSRTLGTFESSRANRVEALAAQYRSGSYRPDAVATSKSMVSEALSAGL